MNIDNFLATIIPLVLLVIVMTNVKYVYRFLKKIILKNKKISKWTESSLDFDIIFKGFIGVFAFIISFGLTTLVVFLIVEGVKLFWN